MLLRRAALRSHVRVRSLSCSQAPIAKGKLIKLSDFEPRGLSAEHIALALTDAWGATGKQWGRLLAAVGYDPTSARPTRGSHVPLVLTMHASQQVELRQAAEQRTEPPPTLPSHDAPRPQLDDTWRADTWHTDTWHGGDTWQVIILTTHGL